MVEVQKMWLWIILWMFVAAVFAAYLPKIKGFMGEKSVAMILSKLTKEEYLVLHNVMLRTNRGTTQIDHIVVSLYGIFVIETKNYKGWIMGDEYASQWVKNQYGKKYYFQNPLKQNYGHVTALEEALALPRELFIPIVVFTPEAELKVKTKALLVYTNRLRRTITSFQIKKMSAEQMKEHHDAILRLNIDSKEVRKEHVQSIRSHVATEKKKIKQGICPKCGGVLVEKSGKYGAFMGCSNYPTCRYTLKKEKNT